MEKVDYLLEIKRIRGFEELTQGEEEVENLLLNEYKRTGNKIVSFYKVRDMVIESSSIKDEIEDFINTIPHINNFENAYSIQKDVLNILQKSLCEKIIRDHVPLSSIESFERATVLLYNKYGKNAQEMIKEIDIYIRTQKPQFSNLLKKALMIIEENNSECEIVV